MIITCNYVANCVVGFYITMYFSAAMIVKDLEPSSQSVELESYSTHTGIGLEPNFDD